MPPAADILAACETVRDGRSIRYALQKGWPKRRALRNIVGGGIIFGGRPA
jgi:hypothetical protein